MYWDVSVFWGERIYVPPPSTALAHFAAATAIADFPPPVGTSRTTNFLWSAYAFAMAESASSWTGRISANGKKSVSIDNCPIHNHIQIYDSMQRQLFCHVQLPQSIKIISLFAVSMLALQDKRDL